MNFAQLTVRCPFAGGRSGYSEEGARTGMSDLDINRSSNTGGGTTGLREGHHGEQPAPLTLVSCTVS